MIFAWVYFFVACVLWVVWAFVVGFMYDPKEDDWEEDVIDNIVCGTGLIVIWPPVALGFAPYIHRPVGA